MKPLIPFLVACFSLLYFTNAGIAPEITTLEDGYNIIAKLPCLGCPFLFQDTSKGEDGPWTERDDDNALLLNISLAYNSFALTLNNRQIHPIYSRLPQIYANQVLQDISVDALSTIVSSGQLEASHETNAGGGYFGLSYSQSLRHVQDSTALVFQFDVIELWSDLTPTPLRHRLERLDQMMLELLLLQKPVYSALEPVSFEIIKAELVRRGHYGLKSSSNQQIMNFLDWDTFGQKGTLTHWLASWGSAMLDFLDSGIWALFITIFGVMVLFVVICVLCIFGCSFWQDDYAQAQHGKAKRRKSKGKGDVELGRMPFKSAEELGLLGRGRVIGVGKSD
ncbi:uncharacterized protein BDR25DRAFT_325778 [Lindgomyces ingoldianus]|uniref:Uncharacterized protein n=1 Tax=Lindgomyces ingoldianus TaxID=673940 RepID=A0ACB6QVE7_9PLEO|nr:uncharacterized protein BDR25DRAFT_325778 [Lindgomyces ingoldianus]KAF2470060.1 hypothetical protein BDR25DRAFT_325778 [Lindgomyces ingoldianus]